MGSKHTYTYVYSLLQLVDELNKFIVYYFIHLMGRGKVRINSIWMHRHQAVLEDCLVHDSKALSTDIVTPTLYKHAIPLTWLSQTTNSATALNMLSLKNSFGFVIFCSTSASVCCLSDFACFFRIFRGMAW